MVTKFISWGFTIMEGQYKTKYAPFERCDYSTIQSQKTIIDKMVYVRQFLDNIPVFIFLLNKQRQIVFANKVFLDFIGTDSIYGMRPGECVNCIYAWEEDGGCGTSEFCSECGAVNAILNSQEKGFDTKECRITQINNDVLDLSVWAKRIEIAGFDFTLFSFSDISNEKRRQVLERIFFHDVLNTAWSLNGFIEMLKDKTSDELDEVLKITEEISVELIDEIKSQRTLTQAESGELELELTAFYTKDILEEVALSYRSQPIAEKRTLIIEHDCCNVNMTSDKKILKRVLGNLTKNALEASVAFDTISLNCEELDDKITFVVKNPSYIPRNIQLQLFQRSFSTKGTGRGIGTHSVKLLTEKYLNGTVTFESTKISGTSFMVTYPKTIIKV